MYAYKYVHIKLHNHITYMCIQTPCLYVPIWRSLQKSSLANWQPTNRLMVVTVKVPDKEPIRHPWRVETNSGQRIQLQRPWELDEGMMIPKVDCFLRDFLGKLRVFFCGCFRLFNRYIHCLGWWCFTPLLGEAWNLISSSSPHVVVGCWVGSCRPFIY